MLSLTSEKLKRYKDLVLFIIKHANSQLLQASDEELVPETENNTEGEPEKFVKDLEALGPTFIKMGQLFSTRTDIFPPSYITALSRLQDNVEPFSFEEVENIVTEELGVRISKAFQEFYAEPIAAASLGQVHKAVTHDGKIVAVKVQRPGIRSIIINDLEALDDIASALDKHTKAGEKFAFGEILNEFRKTILKELDYRIEAQSLTRLNNSLKGYSNIIVPLPVDDYTTSKVLTMDFVKGTKITSISPLAKLEFDSTVLIEELFKAYLDQVLIDGFFHADPHPGNVFLTDDKRIALIDLGMTARVDPNMQESLLKLMLYISEGRGYEAAELSIDMSIKSDLSNREIFIREVSSFVSIAQDA
ncbi:MAG: AarF/ABC1/UbiB kinase family protein, partial [Ignavibacteriaceae bacterium]